MAPRRAVGLAEALPVASIIVGTSCAVWLYRVSKNVPEPYLDEVFHVGQSRAYYAENFTQWDPKITTPPGLYILSYIVFKMTGGQSLPFQRGINTLLLFSLLTHLFDLNPAIIRYKNTIGARLAKRTSVVAIHTAMNICLFPVLFFFAGLYYTDAQNESSLIFGAIPAFLMAATTLLFRQTNVFWVAVFPAGLTVVRTVKELSNKKAIEAAEGKGQVASGIHDVPVADAALEDYMKCALSIAGIALQNPGTVIRTISPFLGLLSLFGAFVAWNGGVVLGDKSNHVATIHLPQMLYLWPYITFFSLPLVFPYLIAFFSPLVPGSVMKALSIPKLSPPRLVLTVAFSGLAAAIVHFNTIIHPFTLADNRHYVFYVFRILLKNPYVKYLAGPVYVITGWAAIQALGSTQGVTVPTLETKVSSEGVDKSKETPKPNIPETEGVQTSFVLVWLATTALSLVTAPLVEPRYFLIPWVIWRLHVAALPPPTPPPAPTGDAKNQRTSGWSDLAWSIWHTYDKRLWLETAWNYVIIEVTHYIFLHKGFEWEQEPGKVQRFMW